MFKKHYQVGKKFIKISDGSFCNKGDLSHFEKLAEKPYKIVWCSDQKDVVKSLDDIFPAKDYIKVKEVIGVGTDIIKYEEPAICEISKKSGEWQEVQTCAYRVDSGLLSSLSEISLDDWILLKDLRLLNGLITMDDKYYITKKCLEALTDIKKDHQVKVIKNCDKKLPPYYFVIAGETFKSTTPNYWSFLALNTSVVRDWMLEDGAALSEIEKTKKAENKKSRE